MKLIKYTLITVFFMITILPTVMLSQQSDPGVSFIYAKKLYDDEMYQLAAEQFHLFAEENSDHPRAAQALQMAGLSYFKSKEFENALKEYTYLIIKFPDANNLDEAQFKIAESFQAVRNYQKAAKAYRQVQIFYPKSNLAEQSLLMAAKMHSMGHNYETAAHILLEFLEIYPRSKHFHEAGLALVEAYIADQKFDLAKIQIDKITGTTKRGYANAKGLYLKGEVELLKGNIQFAANTYNDLIKQYGTAKSEDIIHLLDSAYYKLGDIDHRKGLYEKSNEYLSKISQENDESEMLRADNFFKLRNYAEATKIYNTLNQNADSSKLEEIHFKAGLNFEELNDYTKAINSYSKVIEFSEAKGTVGESNNYYFQSYLKISNNYLKMNQPQASVKYLKKYTQVAEHLPNIDEYQFKIGILYETELNDVERAIRIYYDFLDVYPRSKFIDDANFAIARCFESKNEFSEALKSYKKFINLFPASDLYDKAIERIDYISTYHQSDGATTKAFSNLLKQFSQNNDNPKLMFQLAKMNFSQFKDYKTSAQLLLECYSSDSEKAVSKAELLYFLARSYQLLGEKDNSAAYLDSAKTTFRLLIDNFQNSDFIQESEYHLITIMEFTSSQHDSASYQKIMRELRDYITEYPDNPFHAEIVFKLGNIMLDKGVHSSVDSMEIFNYYQTAIQKTSDNALKGRATYNQAKLLMMMNDQSNAEKKLISFIEAFPQSPQICQAKFALAEIYENKKDFESAKKQYEDIISYYYYSSYADEARIKIGKLLKQKQKYSEALPYFEQVYNRKRTDLMSKEINDLTFEQSLINIADSHMKKGNINSAINYFQRYLDLFPKGQFADQALYALAKIYSTKKADEPGKAIDYLLRLETDFPESSFMYDMTKDLANIYFKEENYESAIDYYKKSLAYSTDLTEERPIISSQIIRCYYRLGNIQTADKLLGNFRSGYRGEKELISKVELEKGEYYLAQKNFKRAEDIFKDVRSKYKNISNGAKAEYLLGKLYFILNKNEDALEILTKMITKYENDPIIPDVYITLGNFYYFQARQVENAMLAYRKVVDFPNVDEKTLKLGMHNLIKCYTDLGLRDQAIALIRQYINYFPEAEDVFDKKVRMGIIFSELNEYDQAIQLFKKLKPEANLENEPRIQYWIGECYFGKGQYLKAISEYLKIAYLSKPTKLLNQYKVTAQYKSGLAYLKIDQPEKGKLLFEKIVKEQGAESVFGKPAMDRINEIDRLLSHQN